MKMGSALTQARYLAELLDFPAPFGWPVAWSGQLCWIFYPPDRDQVNVDITTDWANYVNLYVHTRAEGVQPCGHLWHAFYHIGDIPSVKVVRSSYESKWHLSVRKTSWFTLEITMTPSTTASSHARPDQVGPRLPLLTQFWYEDG